MVFQLYWILPFLRSFLCSNIFLISSPFDLFSIVFGTKDLKEKKLAFIRHKNQILKTPFKLNNRFLNELTRIDLNKCGIYAYKFKSHYRICRIVVERISRQCSEQDNKFDTKVNYITFNPKTLLYGYRKPHQQFLIQFDY